MIQAEKNAVFFHEHAERRRNYGFRAKLRAAGQFLAASKLRRTSSSDLSRYPPDIPQVMFE